ncbi:MAG TPA: hypothetical protein VFQ45_10660 [Longimicrobium sp.]|nr:hypothetical protein [Longimicrobium sp.]
MDTHAISAKERPFARCLLLLCLLSACGRAEAGGADAGFDDVFNRGATLRLAETPEVINVGIEVAPDPRGGFLVADALEGQVRSYAADGALRWHAGRKGAGPGEFRSVVRAVRLRSGQVLATDWNDRFTLYDSAGSAPPATVQTPFKHVEDLEVVDDSTVLVSALLELKTHGPRLHLWNLRRNRVAHSFFAPSRGTPNETAAHMAGWVKAALRGDTIAAVFSLADTVHFFTLDGLRLGAEPIPFRHFRPVAPKMPSGAAVASPVERARWLASFDLVNNVSWLPDGRLVFTYQSMVAEQGLTRRWHLLGMRRGGPALFELRDVPRLMAVDDVRGALYFMTPGSETPNQWTVATLRG